MLKVFFGLFLSNFGFLIWFLLSGELMWISGKYLGKTSLEFDFK